MLYKGIAVGGGTDRRVSDILAVVVADHKIGAVDPLTCILAVRNAALVLELTASPCGQEVDAVMVDIRPDIVVLHYNIIPIGRYLIAPDNVNDTAAPDAGLLTDGV